MFLKLMYITNDPAVAVIAENAGTDRIFLDMEYIGKADRQGGMNTVQSHHTVEDVRRIRQVVQKAELMVRVNPIHEEGEYLGIPHTSSEEEINAVIEAGADVIMLPYFKTAAEVEALVKYVNGRAKVFPLLESKEAADHIEEILKVPGIDEIHIGINDLSLDQGKTFMFQALADGTVDALIDKIKAAGIPYGFGGIAAPGKGMLPAEYIIRDHHRLGSSFVILSRSFCDTSKITDIEEIREIFQSGIKEIRQIEEEADTFTPERFEENHKEVQKRVQMIVDTMNKNR